MSDFELLTIGDASQDAFLFPTESETMCQLDDKECLICFSYGDKIPVDDLEFSIGGNAANNAVGVKRLGVSSAVVLTLGDDEIGDLIVEKLIKEGVATDYVSRLKDTRSNYSLAINYSGERTIFTYKPEINYLLQEELPKVPWMYLTSMGDAFEAPYAKVWQWIKANPETKLAFNPGSRQIRAGVDKNKDILSVSYILYINREEAEKLTGMESSEGKEKELLNAVSSLGPKVPIVTDGANGAYVLYDGKYYKSGVLPVDAYERTGAGDAFGSGCLAGLIKGKTIEESLLMGTVNSASVIGYVGAQRGLLKVDEMTTWLERAKSSKVEVKDF